MLHYSNNTGQGQKSSNRQDHTQGRNTLRENAYALSPVQHSAAEGAVAQEFTDNGHNEEDYRVAQALENAVQSGGPDAVLGGKGRYS